MKKLLVSMLLVLFFISLVGCNDTDKPVVDDSSNSEVSDNIDNSSESEDEKLKFILTAGEAGEYGKLMTFNEGTECEETFYAYFIPEGTYTVTNIGKYMTQLTTYSEERIVTEFGWEEPKESYYVKLFDVGESDTLTIESGQYIELHEPDVFEFVLH